MHYLYVSFKATRFEFLVDLQALAEATAAGTEECWREAGGYSERASEGQWNRSQGAQGCAQPHHHPHHEHTSSNLPRSCNGEEEAFKPFGVQTDTSVSWISTRSRHLNLLPKRHPNPKSGHPARWITRRKAAPVGPGLRDIHQVLTPYSCVTGT